MSRRLMLQDNQEIMMLLTLFVLLFICESTLFVDTDMPFLKAWQVLSFLTGVIIAKKKGEIERIIRDRSVMLICWGYNRFGIHYCCLGL